MNIKALITTLAIIGSSSVAMARPATFSASAEASWSWRTGSRAPIVVRDHRVHREPVRNYDDYVDVREERMVFPNNNVLTEDASVYKGPFPAAHQQIDDGYGYGYYRPRWITVTAPTRIDRGRQFISDIPDFGRVTRIRLQHNAGTTAIDKVLVRFADGGEQVINISANLDRWNSALDFRLAGARTIAALVVYGSSSRGAGYQVLAL